MGWGEIIYLYRVKQSELLIVMAANEFIYILHLFIFDLREYM